MLAAIAQWRYKGFSWVALTGSHYVEELDSGHPSMGYTANHPTRPAKSLHEDDRDDHPLPTLATPETSCCWR